MAQSKVDPDLVRELARLLSENDLTEIEWTEGNRSIRVVRAPEPPAVATAPGEAVPPAPAAPETPGPAGRPAAGFSPDHPGAVTSPMVGTVYRAPAPGAAPFVAPGDTVTKGQTLFIVEAMKTMNPIPAPQGGVVREILVADATPVEYGQLLLIIE